jgi:integrase/recombinase XerD
MFTTWCQQQNLHLSRPSGQTSNRSVATWNRADGLVRRSRAGGARSPRSTATPSEEELLEHSAAVHVRRPRVDDESHAVGLDRNEVGSLLVAAGLGAPTEHALISLLAINGLRISEALGADIDALGVERGHRTLTVLRKGGKIIQVLGVANLDESSINQASEMVNRQVHGRCTIRVRCSLESIVEIEMHQHPEEGDLIR